MLALSSKVESPGYPRPTPSGSRGTGPECVSILAFAFRRHLAGKRLLGRASRARCPSRSGGELTAKGGRGWSGGARAGSVRALGATPIPWLSDALRAFTPPFRPKVPTWVGVRSRSIFPRACFVREIFTGDEPRPSGRLRRDGPPLLLLDPPAARGPGSLLERPGCARGRGVSCVLALVFAPRPAFGGFGPGTPFATHVVVTDGRSAFIFCPVRSSRPC